MNNSTNENRNCALLDTQWNVYRPVSNTCFGLKSTYHDRFNAGATLRSKFDDERNT